MADPPNVWQLVTTDEAIDRADVLLAAAIGADDNPHVFTEQLGRLREEIIRGDNAEISTLFVRFIGALAGIARGSLAQTAQLVAEVDEEHEDNLDRRKQVELHFLEGAVESLRMTRREES